MSTKSYVNSPQALWMDKLAPFATLICLFILCVVFALLSERFMTTSNVVNILRQISMLTIVAVGLTIAMASGELDLSIGGIAALAGISCALLIGTGVPYQLALLAGITIGATVGLFNAAIVVGLGVPSIITTLACTSLLAGVNYLISGGRASYVAMPDAFLHLGRGDIFGLPTPTLLAILVVIAAWFVMHRMTAGRYIYATGSNRMAALVAGISVTRWRTTALVVSGVLAAIAGMLLTSRLGSGQPNAGTAFLLDALSAVFVGMTAFHIGRANIAGTVVGALLIGVLNNGLNLVGADHAIQQMAKGSVLILAVAFVSMRTDLKLF